MRWKRLAVERLKRGWKETRERLKRERERERRETWRRVNVCI